MVSSEIIKIFESLGFNTLVHEKLGTLIEMGPEDAFVFSSIVGASYLCNLNGVTMKGRCEVFIHRSVFQNGYYIYSPGLFDRDLSGKLREGNSSNFLKKAYPKVFLEKKYVLVRDIPFGTSSNVERRVYEEVVGHEDPSNFILYKNFQSGSSTEPFYEYLTSIYFLKSGYITENQVPWFQQNYKYNNKVLNGGIPDFSAFKSSIFKYLIEYGIVKKDQGLVLNMLPVLRNFKSKLEKISNTDTNFEYELYIGEVKSSRSSEQAAVTQLYKYSATELADKYLTIIPDLVDNHIDEFGEVYLKNSKIEVNNPKVSIRKNNQLREIDDKWINTYIKMLLLGNLEFNYITKLINLHRSSLGLELLEEYEAIHLLDTVISVDNKLYFEYLAQSWN